MGTRLVLVLMIPLLGYMVDSYPNPEGFRQMTSIALLASGIAGALLLFVSRNISSYFVSVISLYAIKKNLTASFLQAFFNTSSKDETIYIPTLWRVASDVNTRKTMALSIGVFSLYSTGLFLAFYLSIIFPSNRVMLSQTSGIFTALGALLLSLVIEPRINFSIDNNHSSAPAYVMSMFYGRLISLIFTGQVVLAFFYLVFSLHL